MFSDFTLMEHYHWKEKENSTLRDLKYKGLQNKSIIIQNNEKGKLVGTITDSMRTEFKK